MLISLHLPKTAGTSFRDTLEERFGDRLFLDYDDRPLHQGAVQRKLGCCKIAVSRAFSGFDADYACIHGHFLPFKYRFARGGRPLRFVTWLRDPVQRIQSHYHYWQREFDPQTAGPLHRRVVEERWTLERFALSPELRNMYCLFLWGFPLSRFDFIGITEYFDEDLETFAGAFLGGGARSQVRNAGPGGMGASYDIEADLAARISAFHARDMALYRRALELRRQRVTTARDVQRRGSN